MWANKLLLVFSILSFGSIPISAQDHDWDVLIFTQNWAPAVCVEWMAHNPSHTCDMPKIVDTWTVHGIWPTKLHTKGPGFCNRTWVFNEDLIKPIESELSQVWSPIEVGKHIYDFWKHEWEKHGTCAAVLDSLNNELKYFKKGIEWDEEYSMFEYLEDANITPDDTKTFDVRNIYDAIKDKTKTNPVVECVRVDGKQLLSDIRICFNKELQVVDCDGIVFLERDVYVSHGTRSTIMTSCKLDEPVFYLRKASIVIEPPKRIHVQLFKLVSWLQWFTL